KSGSGLPKLHLFQLLGKRDDVKRWETSKFGREIPRPTFSEFLEVFREQNPELHGASERSLRRSLKRLGYETTPGKPGRPRENRDRTTRLAWRQYRVERMRFVCAWTQLKPANIR